MGNHLNLLNWTTELSKPKNQLGIKPFMPSYYRKAIIKETALVRKNACQVVWGDSGDEPLPTRLGKLYIKCCKVHRTGISLALGSEQL
jgi:hypothetical protein